MSQVEFGQAGEFIEDGGRNCHQVIVAYIED